MNIKVIKLTDDGLARRACKFTLHSQAETSIPMRKLYGSEHSPIRTQLFWIELVDIPTFVSVHFVRHKIGVEHYVQTNRVDRGGKVNTDRTAPVNHAMLVNAQALINMSRKRLCFNASEETREVMVGIKDEVSKLSPCLAEFMVVECVYRGRCPEPRSCGLSESIY
jgi:hypothetical protein